MISVWIVNPAKHLAHSVNAKALEWVMCLGAALFGYALLQPESTFDLSPSYAMMAAYVRAAHLTEDIVGWSIVILAIIRFIILGINGLWKASPAPRGLMSGAYALLWFVIWNGMWESVGFASTGTGIYLALMVGEFVNLLRNFYEWETIRDANSRD